MTVTASDEGLALELVVNVVWCFWCKQRNQQPIVQLNGDCLNRFVRWRRSCLVVTARGRTQRQWQLQAFSVNQMQEPLDWHQMSPLPAPVMSLHLLHILTNLPALKCIFILLFCYSMMFIDTDRSQLFVITDKNCLCGWLWFFWHFSACLLGKKCLHFKLKVWQLCNITKLFYKRMWKSTNN